MKHDELAEDLARHIRAMQNGPMVWTDMQLGPVGSPRPDVYVIAKSYTALRPIAYEVKVSVSDFRADVTAGKWQTYRPMASGIWFAYPDTIKITKDMVPEECGIIVRNMETGKWRAQRKPVLRAIDNLPVLVWQKLLIDGVARERSVQRGPENLYAKFNEWAAHMEARKRWGDTVGDVIKSLSDATKRRDGLQAEIDARRAAADVADKARRDNALVNYERQLASSRTALSYREHELCRALGMPEGSTVAEIVSRLAAVTSALTGGGRLMRMAEQLADQAELLKKRALELESVNAEALIPLQSRADPDGMPAANDSSENSTEQKGSHG